MDEMPQSIMRRLDNGDTVCVAANFDRESCERLANSTANKPKSDESIFFLIEDISLSSEAKNLKNLVDEGELSSQDEDEFSTVVEDYGKEETIENFDTSVNLLVEDMIKINGNVKVDSKVTTKIGSAKRKSSGIFQHMKNKKMMKESQSPVTVGKIKTSNKDSTKTSTVGSSINAEKNINMKTTNSNDKVSVKTQVGTANNASKVVNKTQLTPIDMFKTSSMKKTKHQAEVIENNKICAKVSKNDSYVKNSAATAMKKKAISDNDQLKPKKAKIVPENITSKVIEHNTSKAVDKTKRKEKSTFKIANTMKMSKPPVSVKETIGNSTNDSTSNSSAKISDFTSKEASPEKNKEKCPQKDKETKNVTENDMEMKRKSTSIYQRRHEMKVKHKVAKEEPLFEKPTPAGWTRRAVQRKAGKFAGKYDVYYYSPTGKKFRSSVEIAAYLKETKDTSCTAEDFKFSVLNPIRFGVSTFPKLQEGNIKKKKVRKHSEKNSTDAIASTSSSTPSSEAKKETTTSTGILDKLIPSLSKNKSFNTSSLFATSSNKRKQGTATSNKRKLQIKFPNYKIAANTVSTSTTQHTLKRLTSTYANQIKKIKSLQNKSHILTKKTPMTSNIKFEDSVLFKKRRGRPLKKRSSEYEPPKLSLAEENELIKQIPAKNLIIVLVKCDSLVPISSEIKSDEIKIETNEIVINNDSESTEKQDENKKLVKVEVKSENEEVACNDSEVNKNQGNSKIIIANSNNNKTMKAAEDKKEMISNGDEISDEVTLPAIDIDGKENQDKNKMLALSVNNDTVSVVPPIKNNKAVNKTWKPPNSPYTLIYEKLYSEPWKLLLATIIIKNSTGEVGTVLVWKLLEIYPSLSSLKEATLNELQNLLSAINEPLKYAKKILNFAQEFDTKPWLYPIELSSIGKYGNDAYKIFCIPEWEEVKPNDYDLCVYHSWMTQNHMQLLKLSK